MAQLELIQDHPFIADHALYILECRSFSDIIPALAALPGRYFVTLLVADFTTTTCEDLVTLSNEMIDAGSRYFCAWGKGCPTAHLAFDLACCEYEPDSEHVIPTTDHSNEQLEDAIWYALNCAKPVDPYDRDCHVTLAICVNDTAAGKTIREAFGDPKTFSENNGPTVDDAT